MYLKYLFRNCLALYNCTLVHVYVHIKKLRRAAVVLVRGKLVNNTQVHDQK